MEQGTRKDIGEMNTALLLMTMTMGQYGSYDYIYRPVWYYQYRPQVVRYHVVMPVWMVWSYPTHQYKNRPRQISPGHREERLAREKRPLSPRGREDQLKHAVRQLWSRAANDGSLVHLAVAVQADDYKRMREAVMRYKREKRMGDPNWGGL